MNEIEYRAERAQYYQKHLLKEYTDTDIKWCLLTGLWETSGWISNRDRNSPPILKWLEPGQRTR